MTRNIIHHDGALLLVENGEVIARVEPTRQPYHVHHPDLTLLIQKIKEGWK